MAKKPSRRKKLRRRMFPKRPIGERVVDSVPVTYDEEEIHRRTGIPKSRLRDWSKLRPAERAVVEDWYAEDIRDAWDAAPARSTGQKFDWIENDAWIANSKQRERDMEEMASELEVSNETAWWIIRVYNEPSALRLDEDGMFIATKDLGPWSYARGPKLKQLLGHLRKSQPIAWELLDDPLAREVLTHTWNEDPPEGYETIVDLVSAIETLIAVIERVPPPHLGHPDADAATCIARLLRREGSSERMFARALRLLRMKGENSDKCWDDPEGLAPSCRDCMVRCPIWEERVSPAERRDLVY